jgi:long-chain-fatty-acid---luciferin-component ligase
MTTVATPVTGPAVASISQLDVLLGADGVFDLPPQSAAALRYHHVLDAVAHHLDANPRYAAYAERSGYQPTAGLDQVPLLPTAVFKRSTGGVRTGMAPVVTTTSSGTLGTISRVPRDDETLMRFYASVTAAVRELLAVEDTTTPVANLLPPVVESEHLWVSYVMAGVGLLYPARSYFRDGTLDLDGLLDDLDRLPDDRSCALVGPPAFLLDLARAATARPPGGLRLAEGSLVVAMGGWKRRQGEAVDRSTFDTTVAAALGIDPSRVRDAFNMVELNTVITECAHARKHCPPWLYARARDPRTLATLPSGAVGLLSFLDATATSYPGFVLSDDLGRVEEDLDCRCGRRTDVLTVVRRVRRTESRGCALKLDSMGARR